jgi:ATP-binding cassette subfamily F protein uup
LSYREQQEWEGMEAAIMAAEEKVATCEAAVSKVPPSDHVAMSAACHALQEAQAVVEKLFARWQELEARRAGGGQ